MAKVDVRRVLVAVFSPVTAERTPSGATFDGTPGYPRDATGELFLLAVPNRNSKGNMPVSVWE